MSISTKNNLSSSEDIVTRKGSGIQLVLGIIILILSIWLKLETNMELLFYILISISIIIIASSFLILINQYERAIILRLGRYNKQLNPGIQIRIPIIDNVLVIDIRERVREFKAERMLTKDNIPVTIDAILRYKIIEKKVNDTILNVENFNEMIKQISQTTLRNSIGSSLFQEILSKREEINHSIRDLIAEESNNWGIMVTGVEIRQVIIPQELESAYVYAGTS